MAWGRVLLVDIWLLDVPLYPWDDFLLEEVDVDGCVHLLLVLEEVGPHLLAITGHGPIDHG